MTLDAATKPDKIVQETRRPVCDGIIMNGVATLIAGRFASVLLTLLAISLAVFVGTSLLPGDVAETLLGQASTAEAAAALRAALHAADPAPLRYLHWLQGLLTGDPGTSLITRLPVSAMIGPRLGNSLLLAALTAVVAVPAALALGITAAVWRGSWLDRGVAMASIAAISVPDFLVATVAVMLFAVTLQWFPALSVPHATSLGELFQSFTLPVLTLCLGVIAQMSRMTRAALVGVLDSPYVEMARLKGVGSARIVLRHALPNAAGPIANAAALSLSSLLGGVIIVEVIFNYPGLAKLMVDAVATRDMPLIQACAMLFCAGYLLLVLVADVFSVLSNPRLRHG
jgi:peptide/nickel transport system permease protein